MEPLTGVAADGQQQPDGRLKFIPSTVIRLMGYSDVLLDVLNNSNRMTIWLST